ncbi:unnamed protein product [Rotaria socialis]|uniref:RING-type domain-containing protein n=1 Tax=Rotaria socialis TaxID=392032 RepID=A0A819YEN6_9BILA|nr:unnamed protein product [Rotaria socialis]CAF3346068.1 unnamed protein product [Rotaria socialis]CAF3378859.1 unnamed protein product [Rotaria socialis]CAF3495394.1 unnamed protein product [Rotaria socialis]CAF3506263.1 unnamed protein product [Rotaria socialis]
MAKQLSMEDLIKKYQYLKSNQVLTARTEKNLKTHETDRTSDEDYSKYSKSSSMLHDETGASAQSMLSNNPLESSSASNSEDACKVCLDAEANCAFIECGHIVSCLNCAKLLTRCPICRETIKRTLRVYKS